MAKVLNGGLMAHIIQENGNSIKLQEEEHFIMLMVTFIKVSGKVTNPMALENTNTPMELSIKVNGKMINKMEEEFKSGPMDKNIKGNLIWVSNQEKES